PLQPLAELRTSDGLVLRHQYTLASTRDRWFAAIACAGTLVLPPAAAVHSVAADFALESSESPHVHVDADEFFFDPLLAFGPGWLLAPNLALNALAMALTWRTLRRRGASRERALVWVCFLAVVGLAGLVVRAMFETKRAWRRTARSAPVPLRIGPEATRG